MKIAEQWVYPASERDVYAMIVDPSFQESKCEATRAIDYSVQIQPAGGGDTVVTRRTMSTASFPSQFKSLVGDTLEIIETQAWGASGSDGTRLADLTVQIKGLPIGLTGTLSAEPSGVTTVMQVCGELKARIPLIGAKIEQAAAPSIVSAIESEADTGKKYLAG